MHEAECQPNRRVVIIISGHQEICGTIIEVLPFHYRGQGARVIVLCDETSGNEFSNTRREFRADQLRAL